VKVKSLPIAASGTRIAAGVDFFGLLVLFDGISPQLVERSGYFRKFE